MLVSILGILRINFYMEAEGCPLHQQTILKQFNSDTIYLKMA